MPAESDPGFPVGYQVAGDRNHDDACQLVYVTDGTMINWLREGRLSRIGTVIVDEAHERSTNIDFIMGYLKRELDRYPHLRVIITSATFDTEFYQEYFGGPGGRQRHGRPGRQDVRLRDAAVPRARRTPKRRGRRWSSRRGATRSCR